MQPIEIITIIGCVVVVGGVFGNWVFRKLTHRTGGECSVCQKRAKGFIKAYRKKYPRKK